MSRRGSLWVVVLFVAAVFLAGCHGDPNVRKQKYLESGKRYSADGKYRESVIQYSNALKIDKNFADAHYELAQAYLHLGQFNAAYGELSRTVELQPTNYKARLDLGSLSLAGGKPDLAQAQADAILAAQPDNPDLHALLSAISAKKGLKDQAMTEIQRAVALDPNRPAFHEDLALLQAGDPTKISNVEAELKKAVALDPKAVNSKLLLAAFYIKSNRWPEAEQAVRDAMATDPKSLSARENLAQIFLRQNNPAKAEEVLRQAANDLADNPQGVEVLADYFVASAQLDKAKTEFASLSAKYPKNLPLQESYVRVLLQVKDYQTAKKIIAELMKKNSKDPQVAILNGIVLLNDGNAGDAVNALQDAAKNAPKDAFTQFWLGKAALAKGDVPLAEKSFRMAADLNPSHLEAQEELARLASLHGDIDSLSNVANKTIAVAPRFGGGYLWRAMVEIRRNSFDAADADLKTAITLAPQSPLAYLQLGKLRFAQKKFPEGVVFLQQTLDRDANSIEAMRLLVGYDIFQKQPAKALDRLNGQIAKSPKNSGFYDLLAQLQVQNKNLDQAATIAQKAMQLNPSDGEAVMLYAQIQIERGQTASAISVWEQWSSTHPSDANALAILGTLEESRGNMQKAEAYYKKALDYQSEQPIATNNLAYLMLQNGENVDVALTYAQAARRAMPNSPNSADTLAWAYYHKGAFSFARDLLEDATKTTPNNATMQYHLGMVYSKLNDKTNASQHLKKALALGGSTQTAKDANTALQGLR